MNTKDAFLLSLASEYKHFTRKKLSELTNISIPTLDRHLRRMRLLGFISKKKIVPIVASHYPIKKNNVFAACSLLDSNQLPKTIENVLLMTILCQESNSPSLRYQFVRNLLSRFKVTQRNIGKLLKTFCKCNIIRIEKQRKTEKMVFFLFQNPTINLVNLDKKAIISLKKNQSANVLYLNTDSSFLSVNKDKYRSSESFKTEIQNNTRTSIHFANITKNITSNQKNTFLSKINKEGDFSMSKKKENAQQCGQNSLISLEIQKTSETTTQPVKNPHSAIMQVLSKTILGGRTDTQIKKYVRGLASFVKKAIVEQNATEEDAINWVKCWEMGIKRDYSKLVYVPLDAFNQTLSLSRKMMTQFGEFEKMIELIAIEMTSFQIGQRVIPDKVKALAQDCVWAAFKIDEWKDIRQMVSDETFKTIFKLYRTEKPYVKIESFIHSNSWKQFCIWYLCLPKFSFQKNFHVMRNAAQSENVITSQRYIPPTNKYDVESSSFVDIEGCENPF